MKRSLLLFVLAACGAELSAEPLDFAGAPLRIDRPHPAPERLPPAFRWESQTPLFETTHVFYDLNEPRYLFSGPHGLRLDYGIPFPPLRYSDERRWHWPPLDAPGSGYREQRQRFNGP